MNFFEEVLRDIGILLSVTLKPDSHHSCAISLHDKIVLQIELDKQQEALILGILLGELMPGNYREEVLQEALKANISFYPALGAFAYSARKNSLLCFQRFPIEYFSKEHLLQFLPAFIERGELWFEDIKMKRVPQLSTLNLPPPLLNLASVK